MRLTQCGSDTHRRAANRALRHSTGSSSPALMANCDRGDVWRAPRSTRPVHRRGLERSGRCHRCGRCRSLDCFHVGGLRRRPPQVAVDLGRATARCRQPVRAAAAPDHTGCAAGTDLAANGLPQAAHFPIAAFAQHHAVQACVPSMRVCVTLSNRAAPSSSVTPSCNCPQLQGKSTLVERTRYSRSTSAEGCIRRWASSPSVVNSSSPEVMNPDGPPQSSVRAEAPADRRIRWVGPADHCGS